MMRFVSLRGLLLLGFVVAMPVLALPPVARWMDELLYGPPPTDFGLAPGPAAQGGPPLVHDVAPAGYLGDNPALAAAVPGLDGAGAANPPPPPVPVFSPVVAPQQPPEMPPDEPITEATLARLQQIRQRLEDLGADYVVVEAMENGRYRCHCRMLVDPRSRFTRPFEGAAGDPLAATEHVLREVESWRAAQNEARRP